MTNCLLRASLAFAIGFLAAVPAQAANGNKNQANGERRSARMLSRFDTDNSGSFDTEEAQRVRAAFDTLKALDTNHDGQLSDEEIKAAKVPPKRQGKGAGRRGKRNL